jgi:hypothetical protein
VSTPPGAAAREAQAPVEMAAHAWQQDQADLAMSQMTSPSDGHTRAVMAPPPGIAVADETDPRT